MRSITPRNTVVTNKKASRQGGHRLVVFSRPDQVITVGLSMPVRV